MCIISVQVLSLQLAQRQCLFILYVSSFAGVQVHMYMTFFFHGLLLGITNSV